MDYQIDIQNFIEEIESEFVEIRRHIHMNPELSNKEFMTTALIKEKLKEFDVEILDIGAITGVVGLIRGKGKGKTIGIRADIDALPVSENTQVDYESQIDGVMHACGHDIHTTVLLGCAKVLSKFKHHLNGDVKLIFQPAEEKGSGAKQLIGLGVLGNPKIDAIFGLHTWPEIPVGTVGVKYGTMMAAADSLNIKIFGKQTHAAHPHKGIDPLIIAMQVLNSLQTIVSREISPVNSAVLTIGQIIGGTAPNIIPGEVELKGTVRTIEDSVRKEMPKRIESLVKGIATAMRGEAEVVYEYQTGSVKASKEMVDLVVRSAGKSIGNENVRFLEKPSMGTEDFAYYLEQVPGVFFRLGTYNKEFGEEFPLHSPNIIFDDQCIKTGIKVMCSTAIEYLNS